MKPCDRWSCDTLSSLVRGEYQGGDLAYAGVPWSLVSGSLSCDVFTLLMLLCSMGKDGTRRDEAWCDVM